MTRQTESFTGSDSASLAAADVDLSWSDVVPGWSVTSGQAAVASADAVTYARAESDVGGSDMFAEVTLVARAEGSDTAQAAVLARYSSTENTCYMLCRGLDTPSDIALRRTVGGGRATLVVATVTLALPEVLRLEVEGTALRGYINGALVVSTTDSAITSGQRGGIYGYRPSGGAVVVDDFATGLLTDFPSTSGQLSAALPALSASLAATATDPADLTGSVPIPTASMAGTVTDQAVAAGGVPLPAVSFAATVTQTGALSASIPLPAASVSGTVRAGAEVAGAAPLPTASVSGSVTISAELSGAVPLPVAALVAAEGPALGALAGEIPYVVVVLVGEVRAAAVLAGSVPFPAAALVAAVAIPGELAAAIPFPTARLTTAPPITGPLHAAQVVDHPGLTAAGVVDHEGLHAVLT